MNGPSNIENHSNNPSFSLRDYIQSKQMDLGRSLANKSKIYLDTKFWILLRNYELEPQADSSIGYLHSLLTRSVEQGKLLCPLSDAIYQEVLKQSDLRTRQATALLVDRFSDGVSLVTEDERFAQELIDAIYRLAYQDIDIHDCCEMVWTRPIFALGLMIPEVKNLTAKEQLVLQKRFFDYAWETPFSDTIADLPVREGGDIYSGASVFLNEGKQNHADDHKSLKQVFIAEIQGILEAKKDLINDVLVQQYETHTGKAVRDKDERPASLFAGFIREAIKRNKMQDYLPSIHIGAWLHAAVRWDKERKYSENDLMDFHHAMAALPYCDLFLTERSLSTLLNRSDLELAENYTCLVVHNVDEGVSAIESILDSRE